MNKNKILVNERLSLTKNTTSYFKQISIQRRSKVSSVKKHLSNPKTVRDNIKECVASRSVRVLKRNRNQKSEVQCSTDSKKQFYASSIPKVEFDVVASDGGDANLSLSSKSKDPAPNKNLVNYFSIFDGSKATSAMLKADIQDFNNLSMHDKQDDESENDIGCEELDQDYCEQSPSGNKDDIGSSRHLLKHGTNCAQSIPVLSLKKKQIPSIDIHENIFIGGRDRVLTKVETKDTKLQTPVDRNKHDINLSKVYTSIFKQELKNQNQETKQPTEVKPKLANRLKMNIPKHVSTSPNKTLFGAILNSDRPNKPNNPVNTINKKKQDKQNINTKFKANDFLSSKLSSGNRMLKKKSYNLSKLNVKCERSPKTFKVNKRTQETSMEQKLPKSPAGSGLNPNKSIEMAPHDK